jgi:hypothetical protein
MAGLVLVQRKSHYRAHIHGLVVCHLHLYPTCRRANFLVLGARFVLLEAQCAR